MPTAYNRGIPHTFSFFHYKAFLLLCLPLCLCQMQVTVADSLVLNKQSLLVLIWVAFIYFHNQENGAAMFEMVH